MVIGMFRKIYSVKIRKIYSAKILVCYGDETHKNVEASAEHIFNL